jgi:hypothetical protein
MSSNAENSFVSDTAEYAVRLFISSVFIIPLSQWPETRKKIRFMNDWTELQVWNISRACGVAR